MREAYTASRSPSGRAVVDDDIVTSSIARGVGVSVERELAKVYSGCSVCLRLGWTWQPLQDGVARLKTCVEIGRMVVCRKGKRLCPLPCAVLKKSCLSAVQALALPHRF
jgi:hypothetical protein